VNSGELRLSGRRVVLTGASSGIGRALARRLAASGAVQVLVARRAESLEVLAGRIGATALAGDVTEEGFVERLAKHVEDHWGDAPDVLINSAGGFTLSPIVETEPAEVERLLAVNVRAPFELTRCFLPGMLARGSGQIVNIGSIAGRKPFPGNSAYSASKYGLRGLHEVLVEELRGTGVRATWIEPSAVDTPLWEGLDPDARDDLPSRDEMLSPDAVADAILFAVTRPPDVVVEELAIRSNVKRRS
jgi:NADP-dependent 3-hydroxy acid dehydrogenase YdfG